MFSEELRKLRKQKKINQAMLAEAVGMSQATIASWEKGTRKPDVEMLAILADYFNVTVDYLMGRDEAKTDQQDSEKLREIHAIGSQMDDNLLDRTLEYMRFIKSSQSK